MENNSIAQGIQWEFDIERQLAELGFPGTLQSTFDYYKSVDLSEFTLGHIDKYDGEITFYELDFKAGSDGLYNLEKYNVRYRPHIDIPDIEINAVNLQQLDKDLANINWAFDPFPNQDKPEHLYSKAELTLIKDADSALRRIDELLEGGKEAIAMANLLMYKHWTNGYYLRFVQDYEKHKASYEFSQSAIVSGNELPSLKDIRDKLKQRAVQQSQQNNSNHLKSNIMNENNYAYLKDNIKYMGFGENQHDELAQHLRDGKESFQMTFKTEVNKKPFEASLQFRKSDNSDMYFLNSYHASLERTNGEKMEQTFYLNKGKGVTAKEAYNLLEGRAVFKELTNKAGDPYKAWIQLDFQNKDKHNNHEVKQYHENYGYDLKAAVGKYAVQELDGGEKEKSLLQSLQKGNIQSVNIAVNGADQKMFMEANPQYKAVTLYDDHMKRVQKEDLGQYQTVYPVNNKEIKEKTQEEKQDQTKDVRKTAKQKSDDDMELPSKKRTRKKGVSI